MAKRTDGITPFNIGLERCSIDDACLAISTHPTWKNTVMLGGMTKLVDLVSAMKDIEHFKSFLDQHVVDVNTTVAEDSPLWPGFTPLHLAVMFSEQSNNASNCPPAESFEPDLGLIGECLSRGANVIAEDVSGCTPLHLAFRHQRPHAIEKLLQFHHSSANPIDKDNVSHLHIACASGNEGVVERLLQSGADPNLRVLAHLKFSKPSTELQVQCVHAGSTPLHIAVAGTNAQVVKLLVDSGASVNASDENGATPIHSLFVRYSNETIMEIANILLSANPTLMTVSGAEITHLHVASCFNHVDAVKRLLDLGADVDARLGCQSELDDFYERYENDKDGPVDYSDYGNITALDMAVYNLSPKALELLITRGADVLSESPDGSCPLYNMFNIDNGMLYLEVLAELMEENDVLAKRLEEEYGLTALHLACFEANIISVRKLISPEVNVNARFTEKALDWAGSTPLHMIVDHLCHEDSSNVLEIAEILLAAGADVSLCNAEAQTPLLLIASALDDHEVNTGKTRKLISVMLDNTQDFHVNPTDTSGWSHFLLACFVNNEKVIRKFVEHGVDVNSKINLDAEMEGGSSALHLLARKPRRNDPPLKVKTIDVLLAYGADLDARNADGDTVLDLIARNTPDRVDVLQRLVRYSLIEPAVDSLNRALGFPFPDVCCRIVFKCLTNEDLQNLIDAMNN